jgi:hypothetical protein
VKKSDEILTIECTLKNIFNRDVIRGIDVVRANSLLKKWKLLTGYVEDTASPIRNNILEQEPNWQTKNEEQ